MPSKSAGIRDSGFDATLQVVIVRLHFFVVFLSGQLRFLPSGKAVFGLKIGPAKVFFVFREDFS